MDLSSALAADLSLLSAAIEDSDGDLNRRLESFVVDLRGAVGSFLGLTMTIAVEAHEISFTLSERATQAGTSLCIPLSAVTDSRAGSALVLYAATPGAFVDLAADLAWTLTLDPSTFVLDQHLAVPVPSKSVIGLRGHTIVNRAVGALIDRGHTPESAHTELRHHADTEHRSLHAGAQWMLDSIRRHPLPDES